MLPSAPDLKKERAFPCTPFRKKKVLNFKRESTRCTDTRVEILAITEMVEGTLDRMRNCSQQNQLNIGANVLKPM